MRRRVHLHGRFKGYHHGPIEIEAETVWDAVEAVTTQVRGFRPEPRTGKQKIQVVDYPTIEKLRSASDDVDIHIVPAMAFGKNGGVIQTVIGATLIVAGFVIPAGPWTPYLINAGIALVAGGLMQMIAPQPQLGADNEDQVRSKYLNSSANTVKIGTTIPLLYGRYRAGGQIMSLNIDAKDTGL